MNTKKNPTNTPTITEINLLDTANKIALSSKNLHKKCDSIHPKPLNLKASNLKKKLPQLENLPDNLTLFRMSKRESDKSYKVNTLTLFSHNDEVVICTPDLNILDNFKTIKYKTGVSGYAIINHVPTGIHFRTSISSDPNYLMDLENSESEGEKGEGNPPINSLRRMPQPETPLHSPILPRNVALEITASGKTSKEYSTPLVDLKDCNTGEIYKDVLTNKEVQRILESFGIGAKFKIVKVRQRNGKGKGNGDRTNSTFSQNLAGSKQISYIVDILPLSGVDFSDLTI